LKGLIMYKKIFVLFLTCLISFPNLASANLIPCKDSTSFSKRLDASVKKLETRIKKYEPNSPPSLALEEQIERTKLRFNRYSNSGLLCGKDGLPHLITDGRWDHASEFIIPGLLFLYITGWIGWVGRKYLRTICETSNPTQDEIIINVPLALQIMSTGFIWPVSAWQEYITGDLLAESSSITISPR
jgi:photosystem I subunit 3